ncbi:MAG TPA: serine/threonine-protein kinase [Gemmatimonadales bacterium]|nr:serine/threonine-protein kinase [Gemmatimonadales bacterium]
MAALIDRVRQGLAPEYDVRHEIAHGGMGVVFLAHDTALDRPVAVKVIRPEIATATAVERFVREARLLAGINHPNVVPVHRAGEVDGIAYYVMEHIAGETLAERLSHGPLPPVEALKLGRDLLDALEAVHHHGVVHRDVKPSNIFLHAGRALLADFGVARSGAVDGRPSTEATSFIGTPGYMSPEQVSGAPATEQSDLYAAAVVLYEAFTGRRMEAPRPVEEIGWHDIPRRVVPVLKRGLAWSAGARWPDAATFRRALWATRKRPYQQRTVALTIAGVAVGAGLAYLTGWRDRGIRTPELRVETFAVGDQAPAWLGDSIASLLARNLQGNPDFVARGPKQPTSARPDAIARGAIRADKDSTCADVRVEGMAPVSREIAARVCAPAGQLETLAGQLARLVLLEIWTGDRAIIADLPRRHLPRDPRAVTAFLAGERAFSQAQWGPAHAAYLEAEAIDSTCRLCSWRLYDTERWLSWPHDASRTARFVRAADSFPPHYRSLLRAPGLPIAPRIDTLSRASERHFRSALVWWSLGDELFHRGPLVGHARREAITAFERSTALRADFAPAWEHLAWAYTAEGDAAGADSALAHWHAAKSGESSDTFTLALRYLVECAAAWRFLDTAQAARQTRAALRLPAIAEWEGVIVAPRLFPTFDAFPGVVWVGREFAGDRRHHFRQAGLLAMVFGFVALGRLDSAAARLQELVATFPDERLRSFADQYRATLTLVDREALQDRFTDARRELEHQATSGSQPDLRERARWMLALLQQSEGAGPVPGEPPVPWNDVQRVVLDAVRDARAGRWTAALSATDSVVMDSVSQVTDPTLRSILRLLRADWYERTGDVEAARRELRWAEHYWTIGLPMFSPQTAEVDWSLRTLARWRRARLLDRAGADDWEVCASYAHVARDWASGMPVYRARADTARQRLEALACPR